MASRRPRFSTVVTITAVLACVLVHRSSGLPVSDLYPFGPSLGNSVLPTEIDVSSPEVNLDTEIKFFDGTFKSIFVNSNGVLSFMARFPEFSNIEFPLVYPIIAPFYSYIDTRQSGAIYYHESRDPQVLQRASGVIRRSFSTASDFVPRSVFIATWDAVGYHPNGADKQNTFQATISSDGNRSYVEFLYPEDGIQWIQGSSKKDSLPDARAQVGIVSRDGRMHVVRGSGSDQVRNVVRRSNMGEPGHWIFKVGPVEDGVEEPDINGGEAQLGEDTCDTDSSVCHSLASCVPVASGEHCCVCENGFFGNGLTCISEIAPLRIIGSVRGTLNSVNLTDVDIQTYAMVNDGRIYTALTRVPPELGSEFEIITAFINSVGWLFARREAGTPNGYALSGGVLNHTYDIFFPRSNQRVVLMIKYNGLDLFDQLSLQVKIRGNVPSIDPSLIQNLRFPDHEEVFAEETPGVLQSSSRQTFYVSEGDPGTPFTVEQRIEFDVCGKKSTPGLPAEGQPAPLRLHSRQNSISYEPQDELLRYSAVFKITSTLDSADPCALAQCGQHSVCVSEDDAYECQCLSGYMTLTEGGECVDIDECEPGRTLCSPYALCENTPGSYGCTCLPGYFGDGFSCEKVYTCDDSECQEFAMCIDNQCQCLNGYVPLGTICLLNESAIVRAPGEYSECATDPITNVEECLCKSGYTGDGYDCSPIDENGPTMQPQQPEYDPQQPEYDPQRPNYDPQWPQYTTQRPEYDRHRGTCLETQDCHLDAACEFSDELGTFECVCRRGFVGDGRNACNPEKRGCNVAYDCHQEAECVNTDVYERKYECRCRPGFVGDGRKSCIRNAPKDCNDLKNCGVNAECIYIHGARSYRCSCKEGFLGDGYVCRQEKRQEKLRCGPRGIRQCLENENDFLLVNQGIATLKVPLLPGTGPQGIPIHIGFPKEAIGIDVDCQNQRAYWGDVLGNAIKSIYYNGTNQTTFLDIDIGSPEGVSIDWVSRNIYWTDSTKKRIEVASLDYKERKVIADYALENPRGIAVHPQRGKIFWSDWNRRSPKLEWANLDGSQREVFLQGEAVVLPNSLAIDFERDELCWADAGTKSIECISLEYSERRTIATNCSHPFGLTLSSDNYYWTDWASSKIDSASRPEGIRNAPREISMGSGKMYGLVVVPRECNRNVNNACYYRGGCENNQICLPTGPSTRRCVCGHRGIHTPRPQGEHCRDYD